MNLNFISELERILSLKAPERAVYRLLVEHGVLDIHSLKELSSLDEAPLGEALNTLEAKDLIIAVGGGKERYYALPPIELFTESLGNLESNTLSLSDTLRIEKEEINSGISKKLDKLQSKLNARIGKTKETFSKTVEELIKALRASTEVFTESKAQNEELAKEVESVRTMNEEAFQNVKETTNEVVKTGVQTIGENLDSSLGTLKGEVGKLKNAPSTITKRLTDIRTDMEEQLTQMTNRVSQKIDELETDVKSEEELSQFKDVEADLTKIFDALQEKLQKTTKRSEEELISSLSSYVSSLKEVYKRGSEQLENSIARKQEELTSSSTESFQEIKLRISDEVKKAHSNFEEEFLSQISSITKGEEEIKGQINVAIDAFANTLQSQVRNEVQKQNKLLTSKFTAFSDTLETLTGNTRSTLEKTKTSLNQSIGQLIQEFTSLQDAVTTSIANAVTEEENNAIQAKMEMTTSLWEAVSDSLSKFSEETKKIAHFEQEAIKDLILAPLSGLEKESKKILERGQERYVSLYNSLETSFLKQSKESINVTEFQKKTNAVNGLVEEGEGVLKNLPLEEAQSKKLEEIFSKIKQKLSSMEETYRNMPEKIERATKKKDASIPQEVTDITNTVEKDLKKLFQKRKKRVEDTYRKKKNDISKTLGETFDVMRNSMHTIVTESRDKLDTRVEELKASFNQLQIEIRETLSNEIGDIQKRLREEKNSVLQQVSSLTSEIEENMTTITSQLTDLTQKQKETASTLMEETEQFLNSQKKETRQSLASYLNELEESTNKTKTILSDHQENLEELTNEKVEEAINEAKTILTQSYEVIGKEIVEAKENIVQEIQKNAEDVETTLKSSVSDYTNLLDRDASQLISEVKTKVSSEFAEAEHAVAKLQERFSEIGVSMDETSTSAINSIHNALSDGIENINTELRETIKELVANTNKTTEDTQRELFANIKEAFEDFQETETKTLSTSLEEVKGALDALTKSLEDHIAQLEKRKEKYEDLTGDITRNLLTKLNSQLEATREATKENLSESQGEIIGNVRTCIQKVQANLSELVDQYQNLRTFSSEVKRDLIDIEKKKTAKIWQVLGKDGIYSLITSMMKRTEQSFTLLASEVPHEVIDSLKEFQQGVVELVVPEGTDVGELADSAWVQKSKEGINGMIAIRDSSEVLIVPDGETQEDGDWRGVSFISKKGLPLKF